MKNIKKIAVLSAAIGAMAALAVPSMASAKVWGPVNTNQTLATVNFTSTYTGSTNPADYSWTCNNHQLGVHVRTPASSTLDVTSASWSTCLGTSGMAGCPVTITPTGLPWTAVNTTGNNVSITEHATVTFGGSGPFCWLHGTTLDMQGTMIAFWDATAHQLKFTNAVGLNLSYMGTQVQSMIANSVLTNAALTLT